jgi:hypothetical protein
MSDFDRASAWLNPNISALAVTQDAIAILLNMILSLRMS